MNNITNIRFALALLFVLPLQSLALAQIVVNEKNTASIQGLKNAVINGDSVVYDPTSVLTFVSGTTLTVTGNEFKYTQMTLISDRAKLKRGEASWLLTGPPGRYSISVSGFSIENGFSEPITYIASIVTSVIPDPPEALSGVAKEANNVMRDYVRRLADDMAKTAAAIKEKKVKTVTELSLFNNAQDTISKAAFKQGMAKVLSSRLGVAELPVSSEATIIDVSNGFRSVK